MRMLVCMFVCPPPGHEKPLTNQTSLTAFRFAYMALAINIPVGMALVTKRVISYC